MITGTYNNKVELISKKPRCTHPLRACGIISFISITATECLNNKAYRIGKSQVVTLSDQLQTRLAPDPESNINY